MPVQEADTDAVAGLPGGDTGADGVDDSDDLVSRDDGLRGVRAQALDGQHVGVADTAGLDPQSDVSGLGVDQLTLDQPEVVDTGRLEGSVRGHAAPECVVGQDGVGTTGQGDVRTRDRAGK